MDQIIIDNNSHLSASFPKTKAPIITPAMKADIVPCILGALDEIVLQGLRNHLALVVHVADKTPFGNYA